MQTHTVTVTEEHNEIPACSNELISVGVDLGMGAIKLYDICGGTQLPSFVAIGGMTKVAGMAGLTRHSPAMQIQIAGQQYYVGLHAHNHGRPIENLDYERLTASPEIIALFYGALTERM